jgi:hypothetical protein
MNGGCIRAGEKRWSSAKVDGFCRRSINATTVDAAAAVLAACLFVGDECGQNVAGKWLLCAGEEKKLYLYFITV